MHVICPSIPPTILLTDWNTKVISISRGPTEMGLWFLQAKRVL